MKHRHLRTLQKLVRASFETLEKRQHLSASTAGAVDPAFGTHGVGSILIPGGGYVNVTDTLVQPDGKIVIVGSAETVDANSRIGSDVASIYTTASPIAEAAPAEVSQSVVIARLNADGTADTSFNGNGYVLTDFNSAPDAEATRVALDGSQLLIAGDANGNFALARYNANGSLDSHFGAGGTISLDLGHDDDKAWGLAVQSDGKIVAEGQSGGEVALVRFNADGSLDNSFGSGGKTFTPAPGAAASTAADGSGPTLDGSGGVQILHGGKFLVVSNETETDYTGRVDFLYYDASGQLTALDKGTTLDSPPSIVDFAALGSGKVITFSSDASAIVQQYNADASLNTAFGDHGTAPATLDWGGYGAVQNDGKILVAGSAYVGYNSGIGVARYNADGSIDTSFGDNGQAISVNGGYGASAVAIDASGGIIAVGSGYEPLGPTITATRFLPNVGVVVPTATLSSAPTLAHSGNTQELLTVTYNSAAGIDPNSLQDDNLTVTKVGSDGSNDLPTYYLSQTTNSDGSITVTYQVQKDWAGHYFDAMDNGTYQVSIADGAVYDYNGVPIAGKQIGTFDVNIATPVGGIQLPTATLGASDISAINVTDATINVTLNSSIGLDANSLGGGVTVTGPNGFNQYGYYQSYKVNADGSVTATYTIQHDDSHEAFTAADNGTYTVTIDEGAVLDLDGNSLKGGVIGTFQVNVPAVDPSLTGGTATLQVSDLTDPNFANQTLTVTYRGPATIATNTLDDYDLTVTASDGTTVTANFFNSTRNSDGSTTAIYTLSVGYGGIVPLGAAGTANSVVVGKPAISAVSMPIWNWGGLANGTYTVALAGNQVNDVRGVSTAATTLGSFNVNLPPRTTPPPGPIYLADLSGSTASTTKTDAHHTNTASSTASSLGTSANTPTRAHAGVKHKHHRKHKHHKKA